MSRTPDLRITSATPYHLAIRAYSWRSVVFGGFDLRLGFCGGWRLGYIYYVYGFSLGGGGVVLGVLGVGGSRGVVGYFYLDWEGLVMVGICVFGWGWGGLRMVCGGVIGFSFWLGRIFWVLILLIARKVRFLKILNAEVMIDG